MKFKYLFPIVLSLITLSSCNDTRKQNEDIIIKETESLSLVGKKALLTYPEFKAEVNYISDTEIHWKTTDLKGSVADGDEKITYKKLSENLYFLNWIEKDGSTISQIIDTKNKTVNSFASFNNEKSPRGKRSSAFLIGKFEIIK